MQPVLTVGSVAFDSIKTPAGEVSRVVGGAATYFSLAASFFTPVRWWRSSVTTSGRSTSASSTAGRLT